MMALAHIRSDLGGLDTSIPELIQSCTMSSTEHEHVEQLALDGLAPVKRKPRVKREKTPASHLPIAQVALDIQATHLGRLFDYYVQEKDSDKAQPGVMVRVRFGAQRVSGIIWARCQSSDTPASAIRFIERVLSPRVVLPKAMRDDIDMIADAYGGTRANIIRVALPARVAWVEEQMPKQGMCELEHDDRRNRLRALARRECQTLARAYDTLPQLCDAIENHDFQSFIVDALASCGRWQHDLASLAALALSCSKNVVFVMPTSREVHEMVGALQWFGLRPYTQDGGDIAILTAALAPPERYRMYLAITQGLVRCVVGTRAAMYAPVEGETLFVAFDDDAYQNADGFMPYANVRGVMRLRARTHHSVMVVASFARSVLSEWETTHAVAGLVCGPSTALHPNRQAIESTMPNIRWLNRNELARLADPSIGARVPHTAVRVIEKALDMGPVLLSIPAEGMGETYSCAQCLAQARCARCTGPLEQTDGAPRCRWCGAAATNWTCPLCGSDRLRIIRVGAAGTAQELRGLFRNTPVIVSTPRTQIVPSIQAAPVIVIATPGAEPMISDGSGYRAIALLDAWNSLYLQGIDANVDVLDTWMRIAAMSSGRDASVLICGETDQLIARSLMTWDSRLLAHEALRERAEAELPPQVAAVIVWGRRDAVVQALDHIGVLSGGDWAVLESGAPAVLGPRPIAQPRTVDARELEATADRVKAVVRVSHEHRAQLAIRLRTEVARHVACREPGELRFQLDPKDLL